MLTTAIVLLAIVGWLAIEYVAFKSLFPKKSKTEDK